MEDSLAQDLMISNDTSDAMVAIPIVIKFIVIYLLELENVK